MDGAAAPRTLPPVSVAAITAPAVAAAPPAAAALNPTVPAPVSAPVPVPAPLPLPAALPAAAPASAATGSERLPQLAERAGAQRREIGPLNPGGSIYAEQPVARMVILNGQVFREGDTLFGQLRIEQIRPRSVVLGLRGSASSWRYEAVVPSCRWSLRR